MARSEAWRSLSGQSVKVFVELSTRYHGHNNGKMSLSLDEASTLLHLGKATVARAFKELTEKGFVKLRRRGHWYGRKASEYQVTTKPCDGLPSSHEWKQWRAPHEGRRSRKIAFLGEGDV
ncbi:MAG: hypothetical protein SGI91_08425 [Alphaproteobacteria bacterium]|nr:hypothetical protein [Alphaproteobacteria bacterium]